MSKSSVCISSFAPGKRKPAIESAAFSDATSRSRGAINVMRRAFLCGVLISVFTHRGAAQPLSAKPAARVKPPATKAFTTKAFTTKAKPVPRQPLSGTPSWILMDVESGRVLAEHDAHRRVFPASTTKTMTALVAISRGNLDRVVVVGPNPPKTGEQSAYLMWGERFTVRDLVRAALIKSANDACVAVAEAVGGDVPSFVRMMNDKAREIGARDTHFVNPHGLHDPQHYTTAYDLALIARAATKYAFFNETVNTRQTTIHGNIKIGATRILTNKNRLLFRWNECDGVKTGYTKQAGRCLIASASRLVSTPSGTRRFRLISVVMHSPDTWSDSAWLLRNQGFARFTPIQVARAGESFGTASVDGGAQSAQAETPRAFVLPLRLDESASLKRQTHFPGLRAPLKSGQVIGRVDFERDGQVLGTTPLVAHEAVAVSVVARVLPSGRSISFTDSALRLVLLCGAALLSALAWFFRPRTTRPITQTNHTPSGQNTRTNHATHSPQNAARQRANQRQPASSIQTPDPNPANRAAARRISGDDAAPDRTAPGDATPNRAPISGAASGGTSANRNASPQIADARNVNDERNGAPKT